MKNTLKYALIILGLLLIGYGLYSFFKPDFLLEAGPIPVEGEGGKRQLLAILGLGFLSVIAGVAFSRR